MAIAATNAVALTISEWLTVLERLPRTGRRTVAESNLRYLIIRVNDREWVKKPRDEVRELALTESEYDLLAGLLAGEQ